MENTDKFGLLPIEIHPGAIGKLLGRGGFRILSDRLVFENDKLSEIPYERVIAAEIEGNSLRLTLDINGSSDIRKMSTIVDTASVAGLINRLIAESKMRREIFSKTLMADKTSSILEEILSWRGQPYVDAVNLLLKCCFDNNASDLHLEPLKDFARITMRKRRQILDLGNYKIEFHERIVARLKHLAGCYSHLTGIPQEGSWSIDTDSNEARLSVFPSLFGERCSIRFIRPIDFPDLQALGWNTESVFAWQKLMASGPGLLLITGAVGSGKTTALYASLSELARSVGGKPKRVVTLEDPVEGRVPGICQASLDSKVGLNIADAFKFLLRQDPDIMALGEIRDQGCLREALQAGLAGHLVLATFHAADSRGAIDRILQMGVEPGLIRTGLKGMINLNMTTKKCPPDKIDVCPECRSGVYHFAQVLEVSEIDVKSAVISPRIIIDTRIIAPKLELSPENPGIFSKVKS